MKHLTLILLMFFSFVISGNDPIDGFKCTAFFVDLQRIARHIEYNDDGERISNDQVPLSYEWADIEKEEAEKMQPLVRLNDKFFNKEHVWERDYEKYWRLIEYGQIAVAERYKAIAKIAEEAGRKRNALHLKAVEANSFVAKQKGASLVLEINRFYSNPLFFDSRCDITQEVADHLNSEYTSTQINRDKVLVSRIRQAMEVDNDHDIEIVRDGDSTIVRIARKEISVEPIDEVFDSFMQRVATEAAVEVEAEVLASDEEVV